MKFLLNNFFPFKKLEFKIEAIEAIDTMCASFKTGGGATVESN